MYLRETNAQLRDDGALEFSFEHGARTRFRITPWREGFTAYRVRGEVFEPTDLWLLVVLPSQGACTTRNTDVNAFLRGIPGDIKALVRPYQFGQCVLLRSLASLAQTADLAKSNPNLLWLIAAAGYDGRVQPSEIGRLCVTKQTDVLRELTGIGSKAQVKLLRKIKAVEGSLTEARDLHAALCDPGILEVVRHLPEVPLPLLGLLAFHGALSREEFVAPMAAKLTDAMKRLEALDAVCERLAGLALTTPAPTLQDVRDTLDPPARPVRPARAPRRVRAPPPELVWQRDFPPPPVPGSDTIVPITTVKELHAEGVRQRNCVFNYAAAVQSGDTYIYRVLAPQRATLAIRLTTVVPEVAELKLRSNRPPSAATVQAVHLWLAERMHTRR